MLGISYTGGRLADPGRQRGLHAHRARVALEPKKGGLVNLRLYHFPRAQFLRLSHNVADHCPKQEGIFV